MTSSAHDSARSPKENPLASITESELRLEVPKAMTVRLTDTSSLAIADVASLLFSIFLSLAIGFGTSFFAASDPSRALKWEFIGWIVVSLIALGVILGLRWKMYRQETHVITYRASRSDLIP